MKKVFIIIVFGIMTLISVGCTDTDEKLNKSNKSNESIFKAIDREDIDGAGQQG